MSFRAKLLSLISLAVVFALGAWASPYLYHFSMKGPSVATSATLPTANPATPLIAGATAPNYRAIVARYGPAVVGVTTEGNTPVSNSDVGLDQWGGTPFGDDPYFKFFHNLPIPHGHILMHGQASGFIVSPNGLILTNAHVVRDADRVTVRLSDHREFEAKVLGVDPTTDIAVLKIQGDHLPTVHCGDANQLAVGDYVLAIGAPYGFEESATSGIVSAKGRSLPGDSSVPFIQTDVAVNPGNSGGPLFDAAGNVVGINSQIYSNTGGYEGLSFAIPINVALHVEDEIVATGKVEHARLGVLAQPLTQALAQAFHLTQPDGALVSSVMPGSAAAKAGIRAGDVILKYNNDVVRDAGDISARVSAARAGDKVHLQLWRNNEAISLDVKLEKTNQIVRADERDNAAKQDELGFAVRPLRPDESKEADIPMVCWLRTSQDRLNSRESSQATSFCRSTTPPS